MRRIAVTITVALAFAVPLTGQAKLKVLHSFGSADDGTEPSGPLTLDGSGNLYGVTFGGPGEYAYGLVFELSPRKNGSWNENILHSFASGNDGAIPWGGLLLDSSGSLYGTVQGETSIAVGGAFELSNSDGVWSNMVLYTGYAGPGLVSGKPDNLYGDMGSGLYKEGAIGELSLGLDGWTYTDLYNDCETYCPDGTGLPAPPIWDAKGNLWGVTTYGGITNPPCATGEGCGVIFVMTPNGNGTWTYHVVHRFASSSTDGQFPLAGLTMDPEGNFYGNTDGGGAHDLGIIFKFSVVNGKLSGSAIYNFSNCSIGCYPEGTLALDTAGNLYGMAQGGTNSCGGFSCGVVYRLAPQANGTWKYSVLVNLSEYTGGVLPFYGLILDDKGNLYGVTSFGGAYGFGTAFEITP